LQPAVPGPSSPAAQDDPDPLLTLHITSLGSADFPVRWNLAFEPRAGWVIRPRSNSDSVTATAPRSRPTTPPLPPPGTQSPLSLAAGTSRSRSRPARTTAPPRRPASPG